jgi:predicted aminopeptidase
MCGVDDDDYCRAANRLDEALAIFAEREAQFSTLVLNVRDSLEKVRADIVKLRAQQALKSAHPWQS